MPVVADYTAWDTEGLGLAAREPAELRALVVPAWEQFCELAEHVDLTAPSRLPGWRGHEVLVHLGAWPDHPTMQRIVAAARAGDTGPPAAADTTNEALAQAHRDADRDDVLDAVHAAREAVEQFFDTGLAEELSRTWVGSVVGPLPVGSLLVAGAYELAVHALDLVPCGAPEPGASLLYAGLASLVDVTGALSAQHGISAAVTAQSAAGGCRFTADPGTGWRTELLPPGEVHGTGVSGPLHELLDVSAGRVNLVGSLVRGRLRVHRLPTFLRLAPLVEQVPGLPGGAALRSGVQGLSGAGRLSGTLLRRLAGR